MEETEALIKRTAKQMFFGQGRFNAKMHEIASEAGINRALLHYYFRNRENLFDVVLKEAMEESFIRMFDILSTHKKFETKVTEAIHQIVDCLAEYPFIENFIISEINKNPANAITLGTLKKGKAFTRGFLKEIQQYIRQNKLPYLSAEDFIVNMMSLCAYPSSTKPIIKHILGYSEKNYRQFLLRRKKMISRILLATS